LEYHADLFVAHFEKHILPISDQWDAATTIFLQAEHKKWDQNEQTVIQGKFNILESATSTLPIAASPLIQQAPLCHK